MTDVHDLLLIESYRVLDGCRCRAGAAYRRSSHGLLARIREYLGSLGISLGSSTSNPVPTPRPVLTLIQGGAFPPDEAL